MPQQIVYLKREEINSEKWDACIDGATNGLIYSSSFYLDAFSGTWDALVLDDYTAVLPLPWRKKWNFCYVYQPFLTAQTGITGNDLTPEMVSSFLEAIPKKFSYADVQLNAGNVFNVPEYAFRLRTNFILSLNSSYKSLSENYRQQVKRNLQKARKAGCTVEKNIPVEAVLQIAKQYTPGVRSYKNELNQVGKLYAGLQLQNAAVTYGVYNKNQQVIASAVFFFSHNRAYYILVGNHPNGKAVGASHFLIDAFIRDHCNTNLVLDFEGSDLPGLQFFYSSFGAKEETYPALKLNRLPFFFRWFKR